MSGCAQIIDFIELIINPLFLIIQKCEWKGKKRKKKEKH
jgi:hypothetical protein